MTPRNFPGASYAAAAGPFSAGFFADHVELGGGSVIPTCGEGLLLAPAGGIVSGAFCFAGKGWSHGNAWLWNGTRWIDLGIEAYGANEGPPCAFFNGQVYVSTVGAGGKVVVFDALTGARITEFVQDIGTEGIALVDAAGVHPQKPWYGLHGFARYVQIGDVRIGQGPRSGLIAQIGDGPVKLLEAGPWQFIGVSEASGVFAVSASQFNYDGQKHDRGAVRWIDRAAITAAPVYDLAIPVPDLPGTPIPIPVPPKPEPTPMPQAPNELAVVQRVFAAHPEINRVNEETRGRAVDYVIAALGGKPWGRKARNKDGSNLNTDGLTYLRTDGKHEIYDIIDGTNGNATWDGDGTAFNPGENGYWVPGLPVGGASDPLPNSGGNLASVLTATGAAALEATIAKLDARIKALESAKPVEQKPVSLDGLRIALKTDNGHYLCAENGGGGDVNATRESAGGWETFTVETK